MLQKDLISSVFRKPIGSLIEKTKNKDLLLESFAENNHEQNQSKLSQYGKNLDALLNLNGRAEKYLNRNFGISLLDLEGNFIWCDANSERFFENKKKKNQKQNFFNLLTPISIACLRKKFHLSENMNELFAHQKSLGSSITFSYMVYSKKNMNKYIK